MASASSSTLLRWPNVGGRRTSTRTEPGESSDTHEHEHDYLLIQLDGDKVAGIFEEDTHGEYPPGTVEGDVSYGNVFYTKKGGVETAKNTGTKPYREILVELKD